ncbi:RNA polymerase sigma factor [Candidatus Parcubacteria bacterium]|nr:RNA polymerase sigma factor [Patescibacteria group bacterium]MBU4309306.1 RNA polymerase sigma factor [Patescibacteria group bacterium]MBU4432283.1 RNA polymerase sigma factor [Patescibacteria group bacterium]MBU4577667.1 RNA polymerase sigma factor [Patescibacteria group bacterium]MCG2697353.1 RNA polymerase sigma factor [Candidatus Parcubacteria bacterium]
MITENECQKYSDEALVELVLANSDYYACLVNRYTEALRRYVVRLGSNSTDAEDVLQEVFLNAYLHLNDFNKDLKFSSWLYRIAHNQTISAFRKVNVRPTVELSDLAPWQEMARDNCPGKQIDQELLQKKINIILEQLDSKYREVLILKYFEEKDYSEMSDILKKPMGTIATLVNRAKKQFAKIIEGELLN